jgi:hypothetical protein
LIGCSIVGRAREGSASSADADRTPRVRGSSVRATAKESRTARAQYDSAHKRYAPGSTTAPATTR